jgi:hypothetical protein
MQVRFHLFTTSARLFDVATVYYFGLDVWPRSLLAGSVSDGQGAPMRMPVTFRSLKRLDGARFFALKIPLPIETLLRRDGAGA